ncbi:MFS transporter [Fructilactobacillus sp. Tb1]|uniref:MFS transporter n=1 Tax=Fructilactobacillus sp. Tb1 TaxID=3422304 RepID=UPI003D27324F
MKKTKSIIMWLALIGAFLTVLDTGIIFTGTVKLASDLHLNSSQLSWVQVAYVLTYAGFMLLGGKLGDVYGRKKLFIAGLLIFAVGSLMVGISNNASMIIGFRAFQGIGAAILQPTCLAIITDTFEGEELKKAIGYYSAVIGAGAAVGITFGGFCAAFVSWRLGFIINAPIALIMVFVAMKVLRNTKSNQRNLDLIGTVLSVLAMISLSYGIDGSSYPVPTLILSAILWIIFIVSQAYVKEPMMPLIIFKNRERFGAYVGSLLFSAAGVIFWFYIPQFMQLQFKDSAFVAGIGMVPMSILLFFVALQVRKIVKKLGNSKVMLIGLILVFISSVGLTAFAKTTNYWVLFPFTLTFGAGFALALTPLTFSAMDKLSGEITGAASGVYNTTRQFGAALGLALGTSVTAGVLKITTIFSDVMKLSSVLVVVGIVFVVLLVIRKK